MPQMGYDMREGTLVRWLKKEGEEVVRGEAIAEIETDKAVVEMEAYASGVLRRVLVQEGTTVPVGHVIAIIAGAQEPLVEEVAGPVEAALASLVLAAPQEAVSAPAPAPAREIKASPVARRIAQERGIDLAQVKGTGPGGRITREDVEAFAVQVTVAPTASAPVAEAQVLPVEGELRPLTRMREAIARVTARSKQQVPHFYITVDIDMTDALALRQQLNELLGGETRVSVTDLLVRACALALKKHPTLNASYEDGRLRLFPQINVGIAIALEQGLIMPAVPDCGSKSLVEIAKASRDLIERAQRGVLRPEEYTGGTFSISNLGPYDVDSFSAIIFPPQSAVLATGSIHAQPVVRNNEVVVRQVMKATVSVDHRVADGVEAARFLGGVRQSLEKPLHLLWQ